MAGRHAILGPSAAYRWLACTPSARFEEQIQEEESNYALEGTLAHELAALRLQDKGVIPISLDQFMGVRSRVVNFYIMLGYDSDQAHQLFLEMDDYAKDWADLVYAADTEILVEHEYDLSSYIPLGFGTADATRISDNVIHVFDFKYGAGVRVSAAQNKQMMIYGLGALLHAAKQGLTPEYVVLTIFQPRAGGVSTWQIDVAELLKWAEFTVLPKALLAISGQGEFVPGGHCQFCKARNSCAAYFDYFKNVKKISDKRVMTDWQRSFVLTYGPLVASWVNKMEEEAIKDIEKGKNIEGFKLVAGRGKRKFRNEDNVVDILIGEGLDSDQIFSASLRSLTDLEKQFGKKRFAALFKDEIIDTEGTAKLAPVDDDRPAIGRSAADDYDDIENDLL